MLGSRRGTPGPGRRRIRLGLAVLTACLALFVAAQAGRFYVRKYYLFLSDYVRWTLTSGPAHAGPTHIFFLYVDHFEPASNVARTERWAARYEKLARRHRDSEGRVPQRTWFYPGEQPIEANLLRLQKLVRDGFGEVELHLHHSFDTPASLERKYADAIVFFQRFGFLKTTDGQTRFAFVHGNFGLDNAEGDAMCGVTRELEMLKRFGCFADYSFPSVWRDAQPPFVNAIYETVDDDSARSYRRRLPSDALGAGDLTMFLGPLVFVPSWNARRLFLEAEDGHVHPGVPLTTRRVDQWVRANIHLSGRPDWVFVKVWGHGAQSDAAEEETLGPRFDTVLSYLESRYNDGTRYRLHYVTAREAYNLARAAAAGRPGDPSQYYDWIVKPYVTGATR
jgi:hypothetical protein